MSSLASMTSAMQRFNSYAADLASIDKDGVTHNNNTNNEVSKNEAVRLARLKKILKENNNNEAQGNQNDSQNKNENINKQNLEEFSLSGELKNNEKNNLKSLITSPSLAILYEMKENELLNKTPVTLSSSQSQPSDKDKSGLDGLGESERAEVKLKRWLLWELVYRALRRFSKGFLIGYAAKTFLSSISLLLKLRANLFKMNYSQFSKLFMGDSLSYGLSLGSFLTIFESVIRIARYQNGTIITSNKHRRALLAGFAAGSSLLFLPSSSRVSIMLFFLVRAIELLFRYIYSFYPNIANILPKLLLNNLDTALMSLSSAEICWAAMHSRPSLDPSYRAFLDNHCAKPASPVLESYIHANGGSIYENSLPEYSKVQVAMNEWRTKRGAKAITDWSTSNKNLICDIMHCNHESCALSFVDFLSTGWRRTFPVYVPIYVLPLLLFRAKSLIGPNALKILGQTGFSIVRSSSFLTLYCAIGLHSICVSRYLSNGRPSSIHSMLAGLIAGNSVLLEKKGRRIELALYVFSHALLSSYQSLSHLKVIPERIKYGEVLLFSISMAILMHGYISHPDILRVSYTSIFKVLFGSGGVKEQLYIRDEKFQSSNKKENQK